MLYYNYIYENTNLSSCPFLYLGNGFERLYISILFAISFLEICRVSLAHTDLEISIFSLFLVLLDSKLLKFSFSISFPVLKIIIL